MLDVYTFSWNEEKLVPWFLSHYDRSWVRKIVVYDNESDDQTVALLKQDPRVQVETLCTGGAFLEPETMQRIRDRCWHASRGHVKFALVVDFDEFVCALSSSVPWLLQDPRAETVAVGRTVGYQMVSETFPVPEALPNFSKLTQWATRGTPCDLYSKPCLVRVDRVETLNSEPGLHHAAPVDREGWGLPIFRFGSLCTLHYKMLGFDHYWDRVQQQRQRVPQALLQKGVSQHLAGSEEEHRRLFWDFFGRSVDLKF